MSERIATALRFTYPARFLALLLVALAAEGAVGQTFFSGGQVPRFNLISRLDGLPNNAVSSIQQDTRGFMWVGTQSGLTRYNGRDFTTYESVPFADNSLPHNLVQTLYYEEDRDTLWAGTYGGLSRFKIEANDFTTFANDPDNPSSLEDNLVIAIVRGPNEALWVGTQNGLYRMEEEGVFEPIETADPVIRSLFVDSRGTLWTGSYGGLQRWNAVEERFEEPVDGISSPNVMDIEEVRPGELLLAVWGAGVVRYEIDSGAVEERSFADNAIYTVLHGSDGTIWAGSWGGGLLAVAPNGREYTFTADEPDTLASSVVYSLFEDDAGLVWIGTNGGGLHKLSPRQRNFRAFFHDPDAPESLPAGKVNSITKTSDGTLWVGLYGGGLARYDREQDRWSRFTHNPEDPHSLAANIVTLTVEESDGTFWVGSQGGLQKFDREQERFLTWGTHFNQDVPLSDEIIYTLLRTESGELWIGTYHAGVDRYDPETGELRNYRHDPEDSTSLSNNLVYDLLQDSAGRIWVATNSGLNRYMPETDRFKRYTYDRDNRNGISSKTVRVLHEDSRGMLWIGTLSGGLNRWDPSTDSFHHIMQEDGLPDNSIVSILEGAGGRLWLGTQRGLASLSPFSGAIRVLDERDGLFTAEFDVAAFADQEGTLYFGGTHGITRIDSSLQTQNQHSPSAQIIDVRVYEESREPSRISFNDAEITLSPREQMISFEFVGLDYESPQANQYRYKLEGFDQEWTNAGERNYTTYTNLAPGTYEFLVHASNSNGVWTEEPARLTLLVEQPWYTRWWAFLGYLAVLALLAYLGFKARDSIRLTTQNAQLARSNTSLANLNTELEQLSIRDSLTNSFNRRYFDIHLDEEWYRAKRSRSALSLLMVDIDRFKQFNDRFGHVAGDHCLLAVSRSMHAQLSRTTDFVARYGGEEFAIVLFGTELDGATEVAERLRAAVEKECEQRIEGEMQHITISVGVASVYPTGDNTPQYLVEAADAALYVAKNQGRNRVVTASEA